MQCRDGSWRHFPLPRFIWDPGIILGFHCSSGIVHTIVWGKKSHIENDELYVIKSFPKIDLHLGHHHHQVHLEEDILQEESPSFHYDHSGFSCMSIGLAKAPMASPHYMSRAYINHFGKLVLVSLSTLLFMVGCWRSIHLIWKLCQGLG